MDNARKEELIPLAIVCILGMMLWTVFEQARDNARRASCMTNLKQIMLAVLQYQQDYDQKFPIVKGAHLSTDLTPYTTPYGWADAVYPYLKNTQRLHCSVGGFQGAMPEDSAQKGFTDYWFNQRLSGANGDYVNHPEITLAAGDGKDAQTAGDARYAISGLSQDWISRADSPAYSHLDGANYAFVDGHIKWYKPTAIQNTTPPSRGMPTFRTGEDKPKPFTNKREISQ